MTLGAAVHFLINPVDVTVVIVQRSVLEMTGHRGGMKMMPVF